MRGECPPRILGSMRRWWVVILALALCCPACSSAPTTEAKRQSVGKAHKKRSEGPRKTNPPQVYKKRQSACMELRPLVEKYAKEHKLEVELVLGVIKVESGFNPKIRSRVGATGLMQIMPRTGQHMKCGSDLTDPETNIQCGCRVLRRYLDIYDGNLVYGLSAYNTGPGNTNKSARQDQLPFNFQYVEKVLRWRNLFVRYGCM